MTSRDNATCLTLQLYLSLFAGQNWARFTSFKVQSHRFTVQASQTYWQERGPCAMCLCPLYVRVVRKMGSRNVFPFKWQETWESEGNKRVSSAQLRKEKPPKGKFGIKDGQEPPGTFWLFVWGCRGFSFLWSRSGLWCRVFLGALDGWAWVIPGKCLNWVFIEISKNNFWFPNPVSVQVGPANFLLLFGVYCCYLAPGENISKTFK